MGHVFIPPLMKWLAKSCGNKVTGASQLYMKLLKKDLPGLIGPEVSQCSRQVMRVCECLGGGPLNGFKGV